MPEDLVFGRTKLSEVLCYRRFEGDDEICFFRNEERKLFSCNTTVDTRTQTRIPFPIVRYLVVVVFCFDWVFGERLFWIAPVAELDVDGDEEKIIGGF